MPKKRRKPVTVLIDTVGYPNRSRGYILEEPKTEDNADAARLPIRKWPRGRAMVAKGGLPGQIWSGITGRTRGDAKEVDLWDLLERSPLERRADCHQDDRCGGCCYRTLRYETELLLKGNQVKELFANAGLSHLSVGIQRSPLIDRYRNKMEYTFGDAVKGGPLMLGMHRPKRFYEIVETPDCRIVPEDFNRVRAFIQAFYAQRGVDYYHRREKTGSLRHLVVRAGLQTKELMINLVTTSEAPERLELNALLRGLLRLDLDYELVSVWHTTNDSPADAVIPEKTELIYGREYLVETMLGLTFHVGPFSFFQPNVMGAENLYRKALEYAGDLSGKTVYDLYSGTGTITQLLARRAQRAVGVELVEEAVEKARESAARNEIVNAKFIAADVLAELDALAAENDPPEAIVIDPPREGIHPKALPKICAVGARRIVYISCNPTTQVRDIAEMEKLGYRAVDGTAFDQFPRTKHIETVVLMQRI